MRIGKDHLYVLLKVTGCSFQEANHQLLQKKKKDDKSLSTIKSGWVFHSGPFLESSSFRFNYEGYAATSRDLGAFCGRVRYSTPVALK